MIKDFLAILLISIGTLAYIISVIGNFKFKDMLKRVHAAGIGDALALGCIAAGCIILNGLCSTSLKILVALVVLYFTSPVCTHMLTRLEYDANDKLDEECEVER